MSTNWDQYTKNQHDLRKAWESDGSGISASDWGQRHYRNHGESEGRSTDWSSDDEGADWEGYTKSYKDLEDSWKNQGGNQTAAEFGEAHWYNHGKSGGRTLTRQEKAHALKDEKVEEVKSAMKDKAPSDNIYQPDNIYQRERGQSNAGDGGTSNGGWEDLQRFMNKWDTNSGNSGSNTNQNPNNGDSGTDRSERGWGESRPGEAYVQWEGPGNPSWEKRNPQSGGSGPKPISETKTGVAPDYSEYNHDTNDPNPKEGLEGNTYVGRGWADYWNRSIPEVDPDWSNRFRNQHAKFADENRVINRSKLAERIEKRAQFHNDKGDYLGYLNRGENRGENRPNWVQPTPLKKDDQPETNIQPFLDRIYNTGQN